MVFYGQMKIKKMFLAANAQDGFDAHRDKKVQLNTLLYF